jgi:DNA-binding winged helix-turn-helix (wHTH) protein
MDLAAQELRKSGLKLKLQGQPFQVLAALAESAGKIVTREELCEKLWPKDTFVDSDHGLNNAIQKIREILADSAANPRFIETIPRRGYRFIAEVEVAFKPQTSGNHGTSPVEDPETIDATARRASPPSRRTKWKIMSVAGFLFLTGLAGFIRYRPQPRDPSINRAAVTPDSYCANWNGFVNGTSHKYEVQRHGGVPFVVDYSTGLMWQGEGSRYTMDFEGAQDYVHNLNGRRFGGFEDWRLPTLEESMPLATTSENGQPEAVIELGTEVRKGVLHLDRVFGKTAPYIWTADIEPRRRFAWVVYFWDRGCSRLNVDFNAYTRAVRSWR